MQLNCGDLEQTNYQNLENGGGTATSQTKQRVDQLETEVKSLRQQGDQTKQDLTNCVKMEDNGDVRLMGKLWFRNFVIGVRNDDHFAINRNNHPGLLIRSDGLTWLDPVSYASRTLGDFVATPSIDPDNWYRTWFHNDLLRFV